MKLQQNFSQKQQQVQKLAMTQQLQQSLNILQFNTEDLLDYLETASLENPLIEVLEPERSSSLSSRERDDTLDYLNQLPDQSGSLFESLIKQIHLNYRKTFLQKIVLFLVEYIDLNGYLTIDLADVKEQMGASEIQVLDALTLLQQLDPAGVGARDLRECLMLQTERDDYAPNLAYIVLEEYFPELARRQWQEIASALKITLADVQEIFDYIQSLTPHPGAGFGSPVPMYITPDLLVSVKNGELRVQRNKKGSAEVKFQSDYFERMHKIADAETTKYLTEKQQEFRWLEKTLQQRGDTILKVGTLILQHQQDFFLDSSRPLKPLTMKEIAEKAGLHESTVSRAVNGKYLSASFGVFELKSFFVNKTGSGDEELSSEEAKRKLQQLVNEENKAKPYSDQKLMDLLKENGVEISRRTISKYRDQLGIPSSSKRKRYDLS